MRKADVAVVKVSICDMARQWNELEFDEREIYFQWIWILMDDGILYFEDLDEVEAYAKKMYLCDVDQKEKDDPFKGLDINFQEY